MKSVAAVLSLFLALHALSVEAQKLSRAELVERGEIMPHRGYVPKSLESLVRSSDIIVKGRFGDYLSNRPFYGYTEEGEDSLESFMENHDLDAADAFNWSIPLSEYEIVVDDVLKGELDANRIIFRKFESKPTDRSLTHPDVERIFFLVINPDNKTYGVMGEAAILSNNDGFYEFDYFVEPDGPGPGSFIKERYQFLPATKVEAFEQRLISEINRQ